MLISVFTDASHCGQTKIGTYAVWAKAGPKNVLRHSGVFRDEVSDSVEAEMCAIINGLTAAIVFFRPPERSHIIVATDSLSAIAILNGTIQSKKTRKHFEKHCTTVGSMIRAHQIRVEFRHVKAHAGKDTPRKAVNDWADKTARALMRKTRRERHST